MQLNELVHGAKETILFKDTMRKEILIKNKEMINRKEVHIYFDTTKVLLPYFQGTKCILKYSADISNLPYGVAVIPFVCNVLPIVWLTDATLRLDELDEDFYNSIANFKKGYEEMYPNLQFRGKIECNRVIKYQPLCKGNKSLVFFSGGVDAFATLFAHMKERPTIFSICGADIALSNNKGWANVQKQISEVSTKFELSTIQCYSNFREFIDEEKLCDLVASLGVKDDWWHGFQHGIGLIGHAAPLAYTYGYSMNYIASSYTIRERPYVTCASDPRIDNYMEFCSAKVCHDQFEFNRQEKIKHIVDYCKNTHCTVNLRVCWIIDSGENCCKCEKCIRTIYALMVEKEDPRKYGFTNLNLRVIEKKLKYNIKIPEIIMPLWDDIINRLNEQRKGTTQIEWLRDYNARKLNDNLIKRLYLKVKN